MAASTYDITALRQKIVELMDAARQEIIAAHVAAGQKASGRTADSLEVTSEDSGIGLDVTLWGRQFFAALETGRKPGNVPQGFYQIIRQWSIDKGLSFQSDRARNTFAYFVSRKIAAEGTLLYREGGRNDIYSPTIKKYTDAIDSEVSDWFDVLITNIETHN